MRVDTTDSVLQKGLSFNRVEAKGGSVILLLATRAVIHKVLSDSCPTQLVGSFKSRKEDDFDADRFIRQ